MKENTKGDFELDLKEIYSILWSKKLFIGLTMSIFVLVSIIYSRSLPNIYTSNALLAPTNTNNSPISTQLGQYSSLAGMAGINIPAETGNPSIEAIARIKSYDFFLAHFLPNIKPENLLAVKEWDKQKNKIIYDINIFNPVSNKWIDDDMTSSQDAYSEYKKIISIVENNKSSFVSISIEHKSPFIAKRWLEIIIRNINESMRNENKNIAISSIEFLNSTLETTNNKEIRDAISQLLQSQMQNLMLASASENYVYKILDSPFAPERKSSPNRSFIVVFAALIGFFIGVFLCLLAHYKNET